MFKMLCPDILILTACQMFKFFVFIPKQEYRARKRQRIQKRITDQLRQDRQRSGASTSSGVSGDLQQIIASISGRGGGGGAKTKGSRFTHTEKLLFAKVCSG